ncbi:hypothetical protein K525DRAFT_213628 [Schizophyllum commune Loenen D]|nr:hypothetical protein K525DRAFT_213628 [Schizophyllum commune Loenen D]
MHHILFDCESEERQECWKQAEKLWQETGENWYAPSLGTVVGAACVIIPDGNGENGARKHGLERLYTIITSESAHLIWKMRCERVIQNEGRRFSKPEVQNRWRSTINYRFDLDRRMTSSRFGKKAIRASIVDSTWESVINDYENLLPNWIGNCGVLVGIRYGEG